MGYQPFFRDRGRYEMPASSLAVYPHRVLVRDVCDIQVLSVVLVRLLAAGSGKRNRNSLLPPSRLQNQMPLHTRRYRPTWVVVPTIEVCAHLPRTLRTPAKNLAGRFNCFVVCHLGLRVCVLLGGCLLVLSLAPLSCICARSVTLGERQRQPPRTDALCKLLYSSSLPCSAPDSPCSSRIFLARSTKSDGLCPAGCWRDDHTSRFSGELFCLSPSR